MQYHKTKKCLCNNFMAQTADSQHSFYLIIASANLVAMSVFWRGMETSSQRGLLLHIPNSLT